MPANDAVGAGTRPRGPQAGGRAGDPVDLDAPRQRAPAPDLGAPGTLQASQVRAMFDRISGMYDLMNSAMTAGMHHRWRRRAVELAGVGPGSRVLDVATGTGDLALELARRVAPDGSVTGSDFSEAMLRRAQAKAQGTPAGLLRFEWGDAMSLPYPENSFDAATVGFGARNFSDLARGIAEMARVVRPGGRVVILEITTPQRPPLSLFYRLWFDEIVPLLGRVAALAAAIGRRAARASDPAAAGGIAAAYRYLPSSVRRFPSPAALAAELERAGLTEIRWTITAGGIICMHAATVQDGR